MDTDEKRIKHLEMIQGVINRLAGNSFAMKGWSVTLISALIVVAVDKGKGEFALVGVFPALVFWILDGYFLWQERLFHQLFNAVRLEKMQKPEDFFTMDTRLFLKTAPSWLHTTFSIGKKPNTLLCFHGTVILSVLIAVKILN